MARKKKAPETFDLIFDQQVLKSGVQGQPFDVVIRFTKGSSTPEVFMDELVDQVLQSLVDRYGRIVLKFNWFDKNVLVIAPDEIPQNTSVTSPEALQSTIGSNPSPISESE